MTKTKSTAINLTLAKLVPPLVDEMMSAFQFLEREIVAEHINSSMRSAIDTLTEWDVESYIRDTYGSDVLRAYIRARQDERNRRSDERAAREWRELGIDPADL